MAKLSTPQKKIRQLEAGYVAIIAILALMVVGSPFLVHRWIALPQGLSGEQQTLEALLIAVLLGVGYALSRIYRNLLKDYREQIRRLDMSNTRLRGRLTDAFKYIGKVNVEIQEIRSIFSLFDRLPQSRRDFKILLRALAQKALTIANADWVAVRVIERPSLRTVIEHLESRTANTLHPPHIGNKSVVAGEPIPGHAVIRCETKGRDITVVCILPRDELSWEERILLEAVTGEIELLFLTFTALHFHGEAPGIY
jgi:hypothetical protein